TVGKPPLAARRTERARSAGCGALLDYGFGAGEIATTHVTPVAEVRACAASTGAADRGDTRAGARPRAGPRTRGARCRGRGSPGGVRRRGRRGSDGGAR